MSDAIRIKESRAVVHESVVEEYTPESIREIWSGDTTETSLVIALLERWESAAKDLAHYKARAEAAERECEAFATPHALLVQRIERETAEAIAAFVDARYGQGFDKPTRIAADIRAGAWRGEKT